MENLKDKVALVTGGGRGIGRAIALELAARGAKVAIVARSQAEVEAVAQELKNLGGPALPLTQDVSQSADVARQVVEDVTKALGAPDILVNNAGMNGPFGKLWELDPAEWTHALLLNVATPFWLSHAVLPRMLAKGWGRIVNISSGAARNPIARFGAYPTTKAALDMLTRHLGAELIETGVSTLSVHPGMVDTGMQVLIRQQSTEQIGEAMAQRFHGFYDNGQLQDPARPAQFVANLISQTDTDLNAQIVDISDPSYSHFLTSSFETVKFFNN